MVKTDQIRILVVDDDPDILSATSRILKKAGYSVIEGSSGKDALELAQQQMPDLLLLDVILPDIKGIDVLKKLKKDRQTKQIPVILISSIKTDSFDQTIALETGADQYIARPIPNRELLARIQAFLRIKAIETELSRHRKHLENVVDERTRALKKQIREKEAAQQFLRHQKTTISLNNDIAAIFLTSNPNDIYLEIINLLREALDCRFGILGYINEYQDLVCPRISRKIWPTFAGMETKQIYPYTCWSGIWAECMTKKQFVRVNQTVKGFSSEIEFKNAMAAPLIAEDTCIGLIGLADHASCFSGEDQARLKMISEFVAPILTIFIQREKNKSQLEIHAKKLEEKNIALNVLLENRDEQRKKIADQVMTNFDQLVFPYYQRIRHSRGTDETDLLVKIMEKNTLESLAPLERSFPMPFRQLTPMEIQVADLIKMGKSSKEISGLLNISTRSVFFHRNNIRKKLNIHGKKVNLRSFLISSV